MYKSYYKRGFTPAKTNRYAAAKARIQSNIANRRMVAATPRQIVIRGGTKKGMDTPLAINTPIINTTNTNGNCFVLNLVQQGAGSWNRVGRNVYLSSVRLKGSFIWLYSAHQITNGNNVRMVVVWDKQPSGTAIPTFDTVFGRTEQDGTETCQYLDPPRYDNMDRFEVLRDKVYDFTPKANYWIVGGANEDIREIVHFDEYIKLQKRKCTYSGQSQPMTIADISSGALYIYFRGLVSGGTDYSNVTVSAQSVARLRYVDE